MRTDTLASVRDVFGDQFLAYVLDLSDKEAVAEIAREVTPQQDQIVTLLGTIAGAETSTSLDPTLRLGLLAPGADHSIPNQLRMWAGGRLPAAPKSSDAVFTALMPILVECYPLFLLPRRGFMHPLRMLGGISHQHPARLDLERAVLADEYLSKLFTSRDEASGWSGSVLRSTGQGGGIQLWVLPDQQMQVAWEWASLDNETPTFDAVASKLAMTLRLIRTAIAGEPATVPVRIGLSGALLPEATKPFKIGDVTLRPSTERDLARLAFLGQAPGTLQVSDADGNTIKIKYAGDIVAELDVPYAVELRELDAQVEWPTTVRATQSRIVEIVENLRLAIALASSSESKPVNIVLSWTHIMDPFGFGNVNSWSDPSRTAPNLHPHAFTAEQVADWITWAERIHQHRTDRIGVAVRRILQALSERQSPEDILVDAVVVWENLLGASPETTFRTTMALAWLLGADAADRTEKQDRYKKLYGMRSGIVHGFANEEVSKVATAAGEAVETSLAALRVIFRDRPDLLAISRSDRRANRLVLGT